jgi:hypothetical protein
VCVAHINLEVNLLYWAVEKPYVGRLAFTSSSWRRTKNISSKLSDLSHHLPEFSIFVCQQLLTIFESRLDRDFTKKFVDLICVVVNFFDNCRKFSNGKVVLCCGLELLCRNIFQSVDFVLASQTIDLNVKKHSAGVVFRKLRIVIL